MPTISKKNREKIQEQILHLLFTLSPSSIFTSRIAQEIARDEEFTKSLLIDLKNKNAINEIKKNSKGKDYLKRQKWALSSKAYEVYKKHQTKQGSIS